MNEQIKKRQTVFEKNKAQLALQQKKQAELVELKQKTDKEKDELSESIVARFESKLPINEKDKTSKNAFKKIRTLIKKSAKLASQIARIDTAIADKSAQIIEQEKFIADLERQLEEQRTKDTERNEMIDSIFEKNAASVTARNDMKEYLVSNVFHMLHEKGSSKLIENTDSTRKIIIKVKSTISMDMATVDEAKGYLREFFEKFSPNQDQSIQSDNDMVNTISEVFKDLFDFTAIVKPGPNLTKFLSLQLREETFPELRKAQLLLIDAIKSVKSGKYIVLYERATKEENWEPVRQS